MSKIDVMGRQTAEPGELAAENRELRRALADGAGPTLDRDVAPLMGELLSRLDELESDVNDPYAPALAPELRGAVGRAAFGDAMGAVQRFLEAHPEEASRVGPMLEVLKRFDALQHEVALRADQERKA